MQQRRTIRIRLLGIAITAVVSAFASPLELLAQVQLDRFSPPIVAVDQSTIVTAEGKFPTWPPQVSCDRDDVSLVAEKDAGKWSVKVDSNAKPGIAWVRLFDETSASELKPVLISAGPVQLEKEPNDSRQDAQSIQLPHTVTGKLGKRGDSDAFRVSLAAGDQLVVTAIANQFLKSPMDAVLQLTDDRGNVLLQKDDLLGLDPQLIYQTDRDRDVIVRLFAFPETPNSTIGFDGSADFVYALQMTNAGYLDHAATGESDVRVFGYNLDAESETTVSKPTSVSPAIVSMPNALGWALLPNDWPSFPRHLYQDGVKASVPMVVSGHIETANDVHTVHFDGAKGTKYHAEVFSKRNGFLLDSKLTIRDAESGSVLASNDDISRGGYDAGVSFAAKKNAPLLIELSDMVGGYGRRHFYQLVIREQQPDYELSVATDHFVIPSGKSLEIPVSVSREGGFQGQIKISVSGVPEDVTVEPEISKPKGDTEKAVKLKFTSSRKSAWNGLINVTGIEVDDSGEETGLQHDATFSLRPMITIKDVWLSVQSSKKKEVK